MDAAPWSGCCVSAGDENRITVAVAAMMTDRMMGFSHEWVRRATPRPLAGLAQQTTGEHVLTPLSAGRILMAPPVRPAILDWLRWSRAICSSQRRSRYHLLS